VPDWKVAHKEPLRILHASFADYLKDPARSGEFYVGNDKDVDDVVGSRLLTICNECSGNDIDTGMYAVLVFIPDIDVVSTSASVEAAWHRNCLKWDENSSKAITKFHQNLFQDIVSRFRWITLFVLEQPAESPVYAELRNLHMIKLSYYFNTADPRLFVGDLMVKCS
jgi:hypothetical protein